MTEAKKLYKSDAKTALRARANNLRAILGGQISAFPELAIDLAPSSAANDTSFYEAGNICAKYYAANRVPSEAQLIGDLSAMLQLYDALIHGEATTNGAIPGTEGDEPPSMQFEDATQFRFHKRIERNASLS